jgi:hypothetical protein
VKQEEQEGALGKGGDRQLTLRSGFSEEAYDELLGRPSQSSSEMTQNGEESDMPPSYSMVISTRQQRSSQQGSRSPSPLSQKTNVTEKQKDQLVDAAMVAAVGMYNNKKPWWDKQVATGAMTGGGYREKVKKQWHKFLGEQRFKVWVCKCTRKKAGPAKPQYLRMVVEALWNNELTLGLYFQVRICFWRIGHADKS